MEMTTPGQMAPPTYSPRCDTASRVVAVPKSTTRRPQRHFSQAATAFTIRSAPTSRGSS